MRESPFAIFCKVFAMAFYSGAILILCAILPPLMIGAGVVKICQNLSN